MCLLSTAQMMTAIPYNGWSRRFHFRKHVACPGCTLEMIPNIEASLLQTTAQVKPDVDGEERILQVEAVLELEMKIYREGEYTLIQDVYTPHRQCIPVRQERTLERLL